MHNRCCVARNNASSSSSIFGRALQRSRAIPSIVAQNVTQNVTRRQRYYLIGASCLVLVFAVVARTVPTPTPSGTPSPPVSGKQRQHAVARISDMERPLTDAQTRTVSQFRVCRAPPTNNAIYSLISKRTYRCGDQAYSMFGKRLDRLLWNAYNGRANQFVSSSYPPVTRQWGRRPYPLPPSSTVLVMGNSHTRQIVQELLCQYTDVILEAEPMMEHNKRIQSHISTDPDKNVSVESNPNHANITADQSATYVRIAFHNNATLLLVVNSYFFYHTHSCCQGLDNPLEYILNARLSDMSLVFLGRFNHGRVEDSEYAKRLHRLYGIDTETDSSLCVQHLADVYNGPIVSHTTFAAHARPSVEEMQQNISAAMRGRPRRDNIRLVDVRRFTDALGECASTESFRRVGECDNWDVHGHRCTGEFGGHPTLAAWDFVESAFDLLA